MNKQLFVKMFHILLSLLYIVSFATLIVSCRPRHARIAKKIANEIEHASEHHQSRDASETNEVRYKIEGIYQDHNGFVFKQGGILLQTQNGLFLQEGFNKYPVYNNDVATITETYILPDKGEYKYSFGENGTRPLDVSKYQFKCFLPTNTGTCVSYFSVISKL